MMNKRRRSILSGVSKALVLCPHPDDEFGCAGTVCKLTKYGADVLYISFSKCEVSVPEPFPPDVLTRECKASTAGMGIRPDNVIMWDFPVRHFPQYRQEILERLVKVKREYCADLVLLPSSFDTHQDHSTIYSEGFRAFKHATLLGYELPQNLVSFNNTAFVRLSDELLRQKLEALSCYESQKGKRYATEEFIRGLANVRGAQCDADYAEAFEVIRLIG